MEFGRMPRVVTAATVVALGAGSCSAVESRPISGSHVRHVEVGTPVFDTDNSAERACGEVTQSGDYVAGHETYGEQPLGTWRLRVAFPNGTLPLNLDNNCEGDYLYIQGSQASPVPEVS